MDERNIIQKEEYCQELFCQRVRAAFLAISFRFRADIPSARALPPMRPSATAAAFLPSSVVRSSISPVAILSIMTAAPITAAGRFSPLGSRGIAVLVFGHCEFLDRINSTVSDDSYEGHSLIQEPGRR